MPKSAVPTENQITERLNWIRLETQLLFQRLNYFLIGIAFLVTAFAAIVSSNNFSFSGGNEYLLVLAFIICIAGYLLSFFFAATNHLTAVSIPKLGRILYRAKPSNVWDWTDVPWAKKEDIEHGIRGGVLEGQNFFDDIQQALRTPFNPDPKERKFGPHTYLVPAGFMILWIVAWFTLVFFHRWLSSSQSGWEICFFETIVGALIFGVPIAYYIDRVRGGPTMIWHVLAIVFGVLTTSAAICTFSFSTVRVGVWSTFSLGILTILFAALALWHFKNYKYKARK
jgi:hypothetical protein